MDAVTYPDATVSSLIGERFVPVQLNTTDERQEVKEAMEHYALMWTPTIIFLDETGRELRRSVGYVPPPEMAAELWLGLGAFHMAKQRYREAFDAFNTVREKFADTERAAEAFYWTGTAAYKRDNDPQNLIKYWHELRDRFPNSEWWKKASFIDKAA